MVVVMIVMHARGRAVMAVRRPRACPCRGRSALRRIRIRCTSGDLQFRALSVRRRRSSAPESRRIRGRPPKRSASATVLPQSGHQPAPGGRAISSRAPSASVPRATASKQNSSASGSTWLNAPTSTTTRVTRCAPSLRAASTAMSTMLSVSDISCNGRLLERNIPARRESQATTPRGETPAAPGRRPKDGTTGARSASPGKRAGRGDAPVLRRARV